MDARVKIVGVVQIVTVVLLLLTGHGEPAECPSDPSCEGKAFKKNYNSAKAIIHLKVHM